VSRTVPDSRHGIDQPESVDSNILQHPVGQSDNVVLGREQDEGWFVTGVEEISGKHRLRLLGEYDIPIPGRKPSEGLPEGTG
jgi:hypothetical protein